MYMGYKAPEPKTPSAAAPADDLQAAAQYGVPVATISAAAFDQQLKDLGIPL